MSVKVLEYDRDDPAWLHDEDEYSDFDDGEVREGGLFDADGEEWEWLDSESDVVHLDFDNWQVWSASNGPEVAYFVVDIDTGFIDWGPCDTLDEAKEFLDGKIEDWELESVKTESRFPVYMNSAEDGPSESDCDPIGYIKAKDRESAEKIFNQKYKSTRGTKYMLGDVETEGTIKKSNGKWTNRGKNGEHGEFTTKKDADAQRKAMYANGYKGEAVGNDIVTIGIYGDDCGSYGNLGTLVKALKSAGLKVADLEGDEDYGWEMNIIGPAKKIFKMIDGQVPGYDCADVQEFVDEYSIEDLYESVNESKRFWVEINDSDGNLYDSMWVYCDKKSQVNSELKKMLGPGYKARSIEEESYSVKIEGVNGSENQMTITVGSHLNSDGFDVSITDKDGNELFNMDYAYGWDASYDRRWASEDKPYVSDIINELVQEYNVDRSSIKVVNGKNVFNGKNVDKASEFSSKYLECTNTGNIANAPAKHIRMFKDLDKKDESVKTEGVKLEPQLMQFYKIMQDLNKYTGIVMNNLRDNRDLKQYLVGAAAVKIGTALDQIAQIRDSLDY